MLNAGAVNVDVDVEMCRKEGGMVEKKGLSMRQMSLPSQPSER